MPFGVILRGSKSPIPFDRVDQFHLHWFLQKLAAEKVAQLKPDSEIYCFGYLLPGREGYGVVECAGSLEDSLHNKPIRPGYVEQGSITADLNQVAHGIRAHMGTEESYDRKVAYFHRPAKPGLAAFFARFMRVDSLPSELCFEMEDKFVLSELAIRYGKGVFVTVEREGEKDKAPAFLSIEWEPRPAKEAQTPDQQYGVLDIRQKRLEFARFV